jgi:4-carboxymuconolactone decarboxylase
MLFTKHKPHLKTRKLPDTQIPPAMKTLITSLLFTACATSACQAQDDTRVVRLAKLVIDPAHLPAYNALLKEGIEASMREEPGVLTLFAVAERNRPTHITILEIYASPAAYEAHLKTAHFLKYKNSTLTMVKSLELVDADALIPDLNIKPPPAR